MIRFLNVLALLALIGSATWAYSVKYETILVSEKLRKREVELQRERDAIAILKAEWSLLNRPERLALLAKPETGMQPLSARQVVDAKDVPVAPAKTDRIDDLLTGSIPADTTKSPKAAKAPTTPGATGAGGARPKLATTTPSRPAQAKKTPDNKTPAKAPMKTASAPKKASAAPARLMPPAPLGSTTAAPEARKEGGGLTGFLKKLIR